MVVRRLAVALAIAALAASEAKASERVQHDVVLKKSSSIDEALAAYANNFQPVQKHYRSHELAARKTNPVARR